MTEKQWWTRSDLLEKLCWVLYTASTRKSHRKLRLFACACVRQLWGLLDGPGRRAVEVAERLADREIAREDVPKDLMEQEAVLRRHRDRRLLISGAASAERVGYAALFAMHRQPRTAAYASADAAIPLPEQGGWAEVQAAIAGCREVQCRVLHDVFGPLFFRPVAIAAAWLAWNGGAVVALARSVYEDRAFDQLPVLADALAEAGCTDKDILGHCRGPGSHVRGCWVLDLLLDKG